MSFVKSNLVDGEAIRYRAHLHWILYSQSISIIVLGVVIFAYSGIFSKIIPSEYVQYLAYIVFAVGVVKFLASYIEHSSAEFVVTNRRIFIKEGVFNRSSMTISLEHIETVEVSQTLFGRIIGFGSINITASGGAGTEKPIPYLSHPSKFRQSIHANLKHN